MAKNDLDVLFSTGLFIVWKSKFPSTPIWLKKKKAQMDFRLEDSYSLF